MEKCLFKQELVSTLCAIFHSNFILISSQHIYPPSHLHPFEKLKPPTSDTPSILLAMQEGGASVIELGIPYTDPQADGATIQKTNQVAIAGGTSDISACLAMLIKAREMGLTIPVVFMGYYNPFYQFGIEKLCKESAVAGADGFIIVDLPPEEAIELSAACTKYGLSNLLFKNQIQKVV